MEPVIWNKRTGNIIGGHQRLKILKEQGAIEIECVVVDMDESEEKALNIALNKVSCNWDIPKLTEILEDLDKSMFDVSLTGFDISEIEDLFSKVHDKDVQDNDFDADKAIENGDRYLEPLNMVEAGKTQNDDKIKVMTEEIFNLIRK